MKIAIGCDHAAYDVKNKIKKLLISFDYEVVDLGTDNGDSVDYPVYGHAVARKVAKKVTTGYNFRFLGGSYALISV